MISFGEASTTNHNVCMFYGIFILYQNIQIIRLDYLINLSFSYLWNSGTVNSLVLSRL